MVYVSLRDYSIYVELTDTHCHIYLPEYDPDRELTLQSALNAGITRLFLPNVDRSTVNGLLQLTQEQSGCCFPIMGLHPTSVDADFEKELEWIESILNSQHFYGIGETGIDFYWDTTFRDQQEEAFRIQLGWASFRNLPIIIHVRDSYNETVEIIRKSGLNNLSGIFHCFTGTQYQAEEIIDLGFHLGIGGVSTFKNSNLGQVLPHVDPRWIVLETDAPYLAPVPHRGKRNEPAFLVDTARKVAGFLGMTPDELALQTTENSKQLFGI